MYLYVFEKIQVIPMQFLMLFFFFFFKLKLLCFYSELDYLIQDLVLD